MAHILFLLALSALALGAHGCAFPGGACVPAVCNALSLSAFSPLLNSKYFFSNDSGTKTSFSAVPASLGYYFTAYNTEYNGGVFDRSKSANRDAAPFLNYFELRSTLGKLAKTGVSLSSCCNSCAKAAGCSIYLFNPYISTTKAGGVTSKSFKSTGDCYFLLQSEKGQTWTYDRVQEACATDAVTDASVKPYFYAGTCNGDVENDPHFVGAHGTRFDFNGELDKSFCLLTDSRLQLNALLRGYRAPNGEKSIRSWMKELGVVWVGQDGQRHSLQLVARAGKQQERGQGFLARASVDGRALEIPSTPGYSVSEFDMTLTFEGTGKTGPYDVDNFQLQVGDLLDLHLALRVAHPKLQTAEDAEVHFNLIFDSLKVTERIHGVLGQTYRQTPAQQMKAVKYSALSEILGAPVQADGQSGKGFLEGEVSDYETSSVVAPDCKFSTFAA